ncbi:ScbR family autoregulator-binding transcription factor [Gryllotalpicola ginsengisoli]|uniref:ScbR family autoregulator-binding transcription factor n=1 Tax=Gryllotalpicola ginsengisoli TaxID=444608 RepID=UPI0003B4A7DA|nr:ScbR family autoregulator-binding transcription factor [Gryllotalpicola ginsengisoli]
MTQERAVGTRDEIVRAAAAEFDEHGYAGASLSGIASRLGKTKGAMSYHFSSKGALAREVVESQYAQWEDVLTRIRGDGNRGLDAMVLLSFAVAKRFRDDVLVRAGIRLQHDAGLHGVDLPTPFVSWISMTRALLAEAVAMKQVTPPLNAEQSAEVLVEAFTGVQQVAHRLTSARDIDDRVRRYWLLFLPGLGVDDPAGVVERLAAAAAAY